MTDCAICHSHHPDADGDCTDRCRHVDATVGRICDLCHLRILRQSGRGSRAVGGKCMSTWTAPRLVRNPYMEGRHPVHDLTFALTVVMLLHIWCRKGPNPPAICYDYEPDSGMWAYQFGEPTND